MTRDELIDYLTTVLAQAADGPPLGPRPQGTFAGGAPMSGVSGLRVIDPDGNVFYLAVLEEADFESEEA